MHRLALCLVFVASTLAAPRPAAAAPATDVYDTIDSAEVLERDGNFGGRPTLTVRGIPAGASTPMTRTYFFGEGATTDNVNTALHCQRLAVLVMSKPGKFQLGIGHFVAQNSAIGCNLTRVAP